jgi:hypothetical protein
MAASGFFRSLSLMGYCLGESAVDASSFGGKESRRQTRSPMLNKVPHLGRLIISSLVAEGDSQTIVHARLVYVGGCGGLRKGRGSIGKDNPSYRLFVKVQ